MELRMADLDRDWDSIIKAYSQVWENKDFYRQSKMPFVPDRDQFQSLWDSGALMGLIGTKEDGDVGLLYVGMLTPYMYNKEYKYAHELVWYIDRECRSFRNLKTLLSGIDSLMSDIGVDLYALSLPAEFKATGKSLERFGYQMQDAMYMKVINNGG